MKQPRAEFRVKDLIKELRNMDPEAPVVVREYNGVEDVWRVVRTVEERPTNGLELLPGSPLVRVRAVVSLSAFPPDGA